jgi:hypothetical protein
VLTGLLPASHAERQQSVEEGAWSIGMDFTPASATNMPRSLACLSVKCRSPRPFHPLPWVMLPVIRDGKQATLFIDVRQVGLSPRQRVSGPSCSQQEGAAPLTGDVCSGCRRESSERPAQSSSLCFLSTHRLLSSPLPASQAFCFVTTNLRLVPASCWTTTVPRSNPPPPYVM